MGKHNAPEGSEEEKVVVLTQMQLEDLLAEAARTARSIPEWISYDEEIGRDIVSEKVTFS